VVQAEQALHTFIETTGQPKEVLMAEMVVEVVISISVEIETSGH
jgi:hypothetical protein